MKIELRSIHHYARMSEETDCFDAALYVDGKKIGTVSNHGTGGPDEFHGDQKAYDAADQWCKANLPKWTMAESLGAELAESLEATGNQPAEKEFDTDIEMHVANLLHEHLKEKDFKSALGKGTLIIKAGEKGVWRLGKGKPNDSMIAMVKKNYPTATILNTLPLAEAKALYFANVDQR